MTGKKDVYYFPHDSNARSDPKIISLRRLFGWEGYGSFFGVVEFLRDQPNYKILKDAIKDFLFELRIEDKIFDYMLQIGLLKQDESFVYSESLLRRMERVDETRAKRKASAQLGGQARASQMGKQSAKQSASQMGSSKEPDSYQMGSETKSNKRKETTCRNISFSDDQFSFANEMLAKIKAISSSAKANLESWANEIRLMSEVDHIPIEKIKKVFNWANNDSFWKANILSPSSLRRNFPKLEAKMNSDNESDQEQGLPKWM